MLAGLLSQSYDARKPSVFVDFPVLDFVSFNGKTQALQLNFAYACGSPLNPDYSRSSHRRRVLASLFQSEVRFVGVSESARNAPYPEAKFERRKSRIVTGLMGCEVLDREGCAAEMWDVRPAGGKKNPHATRTDDNSRGDFCHQHAISSRMAFTKTVASVTRIVTTSSRTVAFTMKSSVGALASGRPCDADYAEHL